MISLAVGTWQWPVCHRFPVVRPRSSLFYGPRTRVVVVVIVVVVVVVRNSLFYRKSFRARVKYSTIRLRSASATVVLQKRFVPQKLVVETTEQWCTRTVHLTKPTMQTESPSTSAAAAAGADDVETPPPVAAQLNGSGQRSADDKMATKVHKRKVDDFIFGKVIGEGSFSTVYLAKDKHTSRHYAIKAYEKLHILKERKSKDVRREKDVMTILTNSGSSLFVRLSCTFQDRGRLFFVMSYAKNGDMLPFINNVDSFDMTCTQFYSGEILLALEYLHNLNIQHRDLKPENILLDDNMHIKLTDFGCSKVSNLESGMETLNISNPSDNNGKARANSFVGTAQYVSPEIFDDIIPTSFRSDLWAFGCILYQMVAGYPPFRCRTDYLIFRKILNLDYSFPDEFHEDAKDLVQKFLVLEPTKRLGAEDAKRYTSIRSHSFYKELNFDALLKTKPPLSCPDNKNYEVPDNLEPGLGPRQLTRLLVCDELYGNSSKSTNTSVPSTSAAAEGQSTTN